MNALVALGDDRADAQQLRAFGCPVARGAGAVFLAGENHEWDSSLGVVLGGIVNEALFTAEEVPRVTTFDAVEKKVFETDVCEGATDHDLVVAAARAVGVEILAVHAVLAQVLPGGRVGLDGTRGRDVVGRSRVTDLHEYARTFDVTNGIKLHAHPLEIRGLAHVGRVFAPLERVAVRSVEAAPAFVTGEDIGVVVFEHFLRDVLGDRPLDLGGTWPDVSQKDIVAVGIAPERVRVEVEVHGAREGIGDDKGRRSQVVHLDVRVDTPLEVTVAGQHSGHGKITLGNGFGDLWGEGAGVADAGRAAVPDEVEAKFLEERP